MQRPQIEKDDGFAIREVLISYSGVDFPKTVYYRKSKFEIVLRRYVEALKMRRMKMSLWCMKYLLVTLEHAFLKKKFIMGKVSLRLSRYVETQFAMDEILLVISYSCTGFPKKN